MAQVFVCEFETLSLQFSGSRIRGGRHLRLALCDRLLRLAEGSTLDADEHLQQLFDGLG